MPYYIKTILKNFLTAFHTFGKYNVEQNIIQELKFLKDKHYQLQKDFIELYFSIYSKEASKYTSELQFLKNCSSAETFPYTPSFFKSNPKYGFDPSEKLPFIIHKGKKLFFPKNFSKVEIFRIYDSYINKEHILEKGDIGKAPHQYQSPEFQISNNDVLLDIGCAEAILALDNIDIIKKAYLFEADKIWEDPLKATFREYQNKVIIISKRVSDKNNQNETLLSNIINDYQSNFFVKMDIEGAEEDVLKANLDFFHKARNVKAAICTYHKPQHEKNLQQILEANGFSTSFSDGFMLPFEFSDFIPPFFRKGVIRAEKK